MCVKSFILFPCFLWLSRGWNFGSNFVWPSVSPKWRRMVPLPLPGRTTKRVWSWKRWCFLTAEIIHINIYIYIKLDIVSTVFIYIYIGIEASKDVMTDSKFDELEIGHFCWFVWELRDTEKPTLHLDCSELHEPLATSWHWDRSKAVMCPFSHEPEVSQVHTPVLVNSKCWDMLRLKRNSILLDFLQDHDGQFRSYKYTKLAVPKLVLLLAAMQTSTSSSMSFRSSSSNTLSPLGEMSVPKRPAMYVIPRHHSPGQPKEGAFRPIHTFPCLWNQRSR